MDDAREGLEGDFGEDFSHGGVDDAGQGLLEVADVDFRGVVGGVGGIGAERGMGRDGDEKRSAVPVFGVLLHL